MPKTFQIQVKKPLSKQKPNLRQLWLIEKISYKCICRYEPLARTNLDPNLTTAIELIGTGKKKQMRLLKCITKKIQIGLMMKQKD